MARIDAPLRTTDVAAEARRLLQPWFHRRRFGKRRGEAPVAGSIIMLGDMVAPVGEAWQCTEPA